MASTSYTAGWPLCLISNSPTVSSELMRLNQVRARRNQTQTAGPSSPPGHRAAGVSSLPLSQKNSAAISKTNTQLLLLWKLKTTKFFWNENRKKGKFRMNNVFKQFSTQCSFCSLGWRKIVPGEEFHSPPPTPRRTSIFSFLEDKVEGHADFSRRQPERRSKEGKARDLELPIHRPGNSSSQSRVL